MTNSATPRTSAYVAKRNAPYRPPDAACSFGMKVDKSESTTASPIIPGIASRSIADAQFAGDVPPLKNRKAEKCRNNCSIQGPLRMFDFEAFGVSEREVFVNHFWETPRGILNVCKPEVTLWSTAPVNREAGVRLPSCQIAEARFEVR